MDNRVMAIQYLLRASGAAIKPDGVLGSKTQAAINSAPTAIRDVINAIQNVQIIDPSFVSDEMVSELTVAISQATGVPITYLRRTIDIENFRVSGGYKTTLTGTYRGLGQFDRTTWNAVADRAKLPAYDSMTHEASVHAIAQLYIANQLTFRAQFKRRTFTDEIAYLYHNQGAPSAATYLRTGELVYPTQSAKALETFKVARNFSESESRLHVT